VVFKLIIGSLERGWVQPSSIGTPQRGGRQVLYLPNHEINSRVFCDCFSVILVFARAYYLAILILNQVLWLLVVEFYRITYSPPSRCSQWQLVFMISVTVKCVHECFWKWKTIPREQEAQWWLSVKMCYFFLWGKTIKEMPLSRKRRVTSTPPYKACII
jgi:hypothetical protein